jgi:hypothetical protein
MREARDGGQSHREDLGGPHAVGAGDEAHTTRVPLAPGIEQTKSPLC